MAKKKREEPPPQLVAPEVWKEIQSFRPLRLYIKKQKKKGNEGAPLKLRAEFLQASTDKQVKYFQKAIDKYIQLLDDQDISERVQIEGRLFDNLLSRTEQRAYFESLEAPKKPPVSVVSYYRDHNKQQGVDNPKGWATLTPTEKKPFADMLHEAKADFSTQVKNFAENLPDRIKAEYISYINTTGAPPQSDSEKETPAPVKQRRKSVQPVPESFQSPDNDGDQKLTRTELDDLHKCLPSVLYYERKVPDDEKPTFPNTMAKNTHIRSVFNQLSDKKRHKFIVKAGKLWGEFLAEHADIVEKQVPTLHKLLSKKEDIHYYFTALGLPARPASSALILFNNERPANGSQQNWMDQSQATKDEYIKRLPKIKAEYHQALVNFVEKTLPSDYVRLEFFRNIKFASKDYEAATKDRVQDKDEGQLKITQYLKPKGRASSQEASEFERIKQQLLATKLTSEQSKLVERLGQLMKKYVEETTATKASAAKPITAHRASTNSGDVILVNGDHSADDVASAPKKSKKKRKHAVDEPSGSNTAGNDQGKSNATSFSSKKRKGSQMKLS